MNRALSKTLLAAACFPLFSAHAQTSAPISASARLFDVTGKQVGTARISDTPNGAEIVLEVSGLSPGEHAVHIHRDGECAPGADADAGDIVPFGAAGPHFDYKQSHNHGHPSAPAEDAHAGDIPNLHIASGGRGTLRAVSTKLSVQAGPSSVLGRSLVIHEKPDDYRTDPAGNSGGRISCGLIEPTDSGRVTGRHVLPGSNVFPEGVAIDEATSTVYVGSNTEGHLYRFSLKDNRAERFSLGGSPGRESALGMKLDERKRLWIAGGATGKVAIVDSKDGTTLSVVKTPPSPASFLNDLVVSPDGYVYITDSFRPIIFRIRNTAMPPRAIDPWLDLSKTTVPYSSGININGIAVSEDGLYLVAVQSNTGQLWRIDTRRGAVREIALDQALTNGDGVVLRGTTLYVVRNNDNEISKVELDKDFRSGRVTQRFKDPRLKFPTTAAFIGNELVVVNGQLNKLKDAPPLLPFDLLRVRAP